MKLTLVIPAYNEEKIAEATIEAALRYLEREFSGDFELIAVSDGSTDSTSKIFDRLAKSHPSFRPICYSPNRGKGHAVRTGVLAANGDVVVFTDCDLAYGVDIVGNIARHLTESGADIAIGSRSIAKDGYAGYTPLRKLMSKCFLLVVRVAAGFKFSDSQCGIKAFTNAAAKKVFGLCEVDGFSFDLEALMLADRMKLAVAEYPAVIINHRESKVRVVRDTMRMLGDIRRIKKRLKSLNF